jgi:lipopolysaccharide transport system ATP-binding protein
LQRGTYCSRCSIPTHLLNNGWYSISLNLFGRNFADLISVHDLLKVEVQDTQTLRGDYFGGWGGVIRPDIKWTTRCESEKS